MSREGIPLGMLSTHFRSAHRPSEQDLRRLDLYARQAAGFIERCKTEEALRESEQRLRLALESGRMGTWDWNVATNGVIWSSALEIIHGVRPGTFDGTFDGYQKDVHPEDRERLLRSLSESLEKDKQHHIEYRIVRPDGSIRWVEATGTLLRDESGLPTHMMGVCADITERRGPTR